MYAVSQRLVLLAVILVQFLCFYGWTAPDYYFSGDALYYFSRQIDSLPELASRFLSVDELYQYRPLTYVFFTFVLAPLFGNNPAPYHLIAYLFSTVNVFLACACVFYWVGRNLQLTFFAAIVLVLNPVHFFPSFGPTFIDQWLSSFFYFLTTLIVIRNSSKASVLAPATFILALCSKEHSVVLPVHVLLVLLVIGVPLRAAVKRTRTLWIVLIAFIAFQLVIRDGMVFAPESGNPSLQFSFSVTRIVEFLKAAKPAFFYPENYLLDETIGIGRSIRLAVLFPLMALIALAVKRRPKLALSGLAWLVMSLAPVAFLQQPPAARHYHLGLPGLAILFACAFPSWRTMMLATPVFALFTITNVHLYSRESWVTVGARLTRMYLGHIDQLLRETGRSSFYVINGGDPHFYWHVDGGRSLPYVTGQHADFRFGSLQQPLDTDKWLNNGVNVVMASGGEITDAVRGGRFPPASDANVCSVIRKLASGVDGCSVLFRGQPLPFSGASIETPNGLPVFEVAHDVVTMSRTTIRVPASAGLELERHVRLAPESIDGVVVEIYGYRNMVFTKLFSLPLAPGERRELNHLVPPGVYDYVFIRIHPGFNADEQNDWLVWEGDCKDTARCQKVLFKPSEG